MSERYSSSELINKINNFIKSSDIDSLSPKLCEFIDDEYNKEKDKVVNDLGMMMEEVYFHNLTTVYNIGKLWEILHSPTVVKRGRKPKISPIDNVKLQVLKSAIDNVVTGLEDLPNPEFTIGGYKIPDGVTFKGAKLGRKPDSLKNYSFAVSYRAARDDAKLAKSIESVKLIDLTTITNKSIITSEPTSSSDVNSINILNNDQYDNRCYYVDLYDKKSVLIIPSTNIVNTNSTNPTDLATNNVNIDSSGKSDQSGPSDILNLVGTIDTSTPSTPYVPCVINSPINKPAPTSSSSSIPDPISQLKIGAYVLPPPKLSKAALKEMSRPKPIVDRMDVFLARSRALGPPRNSINYIPDNSSSLLVNNSIKLDSGTFASFFPTTTCDTSSTDSSSPSDLVINKIRRLGPGRPIGSKNKTLEEKELEMLNRRPRGRPLGSPNKKGVKSTKKSDKEVIIRDNEVALRINPNMFEVHMLQYTLNNPHVSYAEWLNHSNKIMDRVRDKNDETIKQNVAEWEKNTMREINRIKGKLSMGGFKGKGKGKIIYEPKNEEEKEALEYKYELLETRKDDPFFINLLKRSFEVGSSRKSRFANIADINDLYDMKENSLLDSDNNINVLESIGSVDIKDKFVDDLIDLSDSAVVNNDIGNYYMSGLLENNIVNGSATVDNQNNFGSDIDMAMKAYLTICQYVYSMYNTMK